MKAFIEFDGDMSVGIFGYSYTMEIPDLDLEDTETTDFFRKAITDLYTELDGDFRPRVYFSGEETKD